MGELTVIFLVAIGDFAIPIVVVGAVVALMMIALIYSRYYEKVPPDEAAVFTGGKGNTIVTGAARFRRPGVERVDRMSLAPFEINISLPDAYSGEGVKVKIQAVALVRFGSSQEALATSTQRFLKTDRNTLQAKLQDILSGHVRGVVGTLSVEALNNNRTAFSSKVAEEAAADLTRIGMEIDILTIKEISDEVGYLEALGKARTAEVQRDATIGEAEATRDAQIKSAEAKQLGAEAEAKAEAAIAIAYQGRDEQIAVSRAAVEAAGEKANQAGPLAAAMAEKEVVQAQKAVEEETERAGIAVEEQRVLREENAQKARIIVPAEAQKLAAIAVSEGERDAAINRAEGDKAKLKAEGEGEAEARKAKASALEAELLAEAKGTEAKLKAEAAGRHDLAEALNTYEPQAVQLVLYPALIENLPEMVSGAAGAFANVDKIVMLDSGGDGNGPATKLFGQTITMVAGGLELAKAIGLNIPGLLTKEEPTADGDDKTEDKTEGESPSSRRRIPESTPPPTAT